MEEQKQFQPNKTSSSIGSLQIEPINVYADPNANVSGVNQGNDIVKTFSTIQEETHAKPSFENLCQNQNLINISEYLNDEDIDTYAQREAEILEHSAGPKSGVDQSIASARSIRQQMTTNRDGSSSFHKLSPLGSEIDNIEDSVDLKEFQNMPKAYNNLNTFGQE